MKLIQLLRFILIFAFFMQFSSYAVGKRLLVRPQCIEKVAVSEREDYDALSTEVVMHYTYELIESLCTALQEVLSRLEGSSLYWQWCVDHPVRYALSRSPRQWLQGSGAHLSELYAKQAEAQMQLQGYNIQYGRLVRHQGAFEACVNDQEREAWIRESMHMIWSSTCPLSSLSPLLPRTDCHYLDFAAGRNALKKRVNESIACMYVSIEPVAVPSHWRRNWLPYSIAGVSALAFFGSCYKNQDAIVQGMHAVVEGANNGFNNQIKVPFLALREELTHILWPSGNQAKTGIERCKAELREIQDYLSENSAKPKASYMPLFGPTTNHVNDTIDKGMHAASDLVGVTHDAFEYYSQQFDQLTKGQTLNAQLFALIPAAMSTYAFYKVSCGIKYWFTKRDHRMLRARLWQANDILVRADHELSDEQYGKLLYVLHKESEQAWRNVDSKEYNAFFEDLRYLALPSPTVQQKKETIANMWHKYHALKDV